MAKEAQRLCFVLAVVLCCLQGLNGKDREPSAQMYTRYPVEKGKENILQCYVEKFHPPKIYITLLKNDQPIKSEKTDLSFDNTWAFHQLVYANVTGDWDAEYYCVVEHITLPKPMKVAFDPEF